MEGARRGHGRPPAVDDHIVREGARYEIIGGSSPADEPHATSNATLAYLLRAHVADGYAVAVDMLTRTSEENDFALDASVYPVERDPTAGGWRSSRSRSMSEQPVSVSTEKARDRRWP